MEEKDQYSLQKNSKIKYRSVRNRKPPLEYNSNNCCRQVSLMHAKISGQKFKEKQDSCTASKCSSQICINYYGHLNMYTSDTPPFRKLSSILLFTMAEFNDSAAMNRICKEKSNDFTVEKPGRHNLKQGIKVKLPRDGTCWYHVPLVGCNERASQLCGILPQDSVPQCHHQKISIIPKLCIKHLTGNLQNF